jgi:hypothetical protein
MRPYRLADRLRKLPQDLATGRVGEPLLITVTAFQVGGDPVGPASVEPKADEEFLLRCCTNWLIV